MREAYLKNKPLIHALLSGMFYFLFTCSITYNEDLKHLFAITMLFLPGLTFPILTSYYHLREQPYKLATTILHLALSVLIYHGCVWLFSAERKFIFITMLAGFSGSLLYLFITKLILYKKIPTGLLLLTALLSGFTFAPYAFISHELYMLAIAILLWTFFNGLALNIEYKAYIESEK